MTDVPSWWDDDDRLLEELGHAVREARVPESFVRAGKAAFAWRTADAELAEVQLDSPLPSRCAGSWCLRSPARSSCGTTTAPSGRSRSTRSAGS
ncbi:hypothetical protein [Microbispora sp. NPDC046933]|uniref:hypothetical protein n=1 Tax=Microbispora sp. NPDC046933 TaxID=3155618 RepID=UPI0033F7719A